MKPAYTPPDPPRWHAWAGYFIAPEDLRRDLLEALGLVLFIAGLGALTWLACTFLAPPLELL